jgi:hypothetical protein
MQYVVQQRKSPIQGYGAPVVGFFPNIGPGVMQSRRYSGHTLPGGIGSWLTTGQLRRMGLGSVHKNPHAAARLAGMRGMGQMLDWDNPWGDTSEYSYMSPAEDQQPTQEQQQAQQDAANKAASDPDWGDMFETVLKVGGSLGEKAMEVFGAKKRAQGASDSDIKRDQNMAAMLAAIIKGTQTPVWITVGVIGVLGLVAYAIIRQRRR